VGIDGSGREGWAYLVTAVVPSLIPLEALEAWSGMVNGMLWFDLVWFGLGCDLCLI
jgi:hypothetical protein